jgi:hypothetical protein
MAQTNYTPIILYNSGTTTNAPSASNLASGELAINYTDGKLFYKDNSSAIQVIGWKTTPTTAGGTGLTSYTAGDLPYYASGSALSKLGIGTSGYVLQSNGSAPTWVAQSTLSVGTATNATNTAITDNTSSSATWYPTIVSATTGNLPQTTSSTKLSFVPSTGTLTATSYAGAWVGSTIGTTYGGTGLTSFTANGVVYASSTSALATSSAFTFNGTDVGFTGNLVPGTSGKGINFSATPGPGTNKLLADYEEGTWTIVLTFGGGSSGIVISAQDAFYTKIGRFVHVSGRFALTSKGSSTGTAAITGLPFTINNSNGARPAGIVCWYANMVNANGLTLLGDANTTQATIFIPGSVNVTAATDTNFLNTSGLYFSYTYIV